MGETLHCSGCGLTKSVDEFWIRRDKHGRPRWRKMPCKACAGARNAAASRAHVDMFPERKMYRAARLRARLAGVPFDIEVADIHIPPKCPVLDLPLVLNRGRRGPRDSSPTLDRIVPSLGYVRGNIIVVSWRANRLKSDATVDELKRIVDWYGALGPS